MDFIDFQKLSNRTIDWSSSDRDRLTNFSFGIAGESGELIDHIKKHLFHGHEIDRDYVTKEIGDVLWYLSGMCSALNISLEESAEMNVDKLKKRYPDGFSCERSINREPDA